MVCILGQLLACLVILASHCADFAGERCDQIISSVLVKTVVLEADSLLLPLEMCSWLTCPGFLEKITKGI